MQLTKWYFFVTLLTSWLSGLSSPNYCITSCRHWHCELESRTLIWNDKDCQFSSRYCWFLLKWNMITKKKPLMLKRAIDTNQSITQSSYFYNSSLTGDFKHEEMIYIWTLWMIIGFCLVLCFALELCFLIIKILDILFIVYFL